MKIVFIRLLKILWFLTVVIAPVSIVGTLIFVDGGNHNLVLACLLIVMTIVWCSMLIIVQYLVFGKLHPTYLFDGTLTNKHVNNKDI